MKKIVPAQLCAGTHNILQITQADPGGLNARPGSV